MRKSFDNIPPGQTVCSVCNTLQDNFKFTYYKSRFTADGYRLMTNTNCVECQKVRAKERKLIKDQFSHLTPPTPGTPCECCGRPTYKNWQLDHCHETGKFRGWICKQCNTGLGNLGDTLTSLRAAVSYLERATQSKNPSQIKINS